MQENNKGGRLVRWNFIGGDSMPNNAGIVWFGQGVTASYRIDGGDGWAVLSVYGDGHGYGIGADRSFGSVGAAKRAAVAVEKRRQAAEVTR